MFGSASQTPGGFSFGGNSAPTGNTSAPSLNFATTNNNVPNSGSGISFGSNTMSQNKPLGFSFGNNTATASIGGGFSFNKPAQPTSFGSVTSDSVLGNSKPLESTLPAKASLFGNSSTNPLFGNTNSGLGFGQTSQSLQQPQYTPYGNLSNFQAAEMPKSLTLPPSAEQLKKRRRSSSSSSLLMDDRKTPSLIARVVDNFKKPSKYSLESMRGLFTSKEDITSQNITDSQSRLENYSQSLCLDVTRIPASQSEYRRLIIRNSKDAFSKFDEIDANQVLLSKSFNNEIKSFSKKETTERSETVTSLKPLSKRVKTECSNDKVELTFSKPISEQLQDDSKIDVTNNQIIGDSDYWCTPSIAELSKLTSLELTHVENFSAGRKSYGNLMFKYPVDLTAFEGRWDQLLGSTIVFYKKTLEVYPNETAKPSQGNGLNVPAVITLESVFPSKYNPIDPDAQLLEAHIHRLKTAHGMRFISFDPIFGNYVFEVEHFSIWGIVDEDDDEPELVARWQRQQQNEYLNEKRKIELQINTLEKITGYGQPGDNWKKHKADFGFQAPGGFQFELEREEPIHQNNEMGAITYDNLKNEPNIPEIDEDDASSRKLALHHTKVPDIDELVEVRAYEPEIKDVDMDFINSKTELPVADNWDDQLKLSNGFFSVFNKNLNQRYNIPLDPQSVGNLIFEGKDTSSLPKATIEPFLEFEDSDGYQKCLRTQIVETEFIKRSNGFPLVLLSERVNLNIPLGSFENSENFNVWELMAIIYDDEFVCSFLSPNTMKMCGTSPKKMYYILGLKRKELLCYFLQRLVSNEIDQSFDVSSTGKDHTIDKIYHFICMDNIPDAIQYAINTKNNHLAVILSIIGSDDDSIRETAKAQLNEWKKGASSFIPSGVMKVYKLLSGDILSKEFVDHLEGLSWPVVLFLMIKYGDSNKTLDETIVELINYAERTGISDNVIYQMYFSLFSLIGKKTDLLSTFNVELQFLLMKYLKPVLSFNDTQFDDIVRNFSLTLERAGMVEESIFVLEHMVDDKGNEELLTKLLHKNVNELKFLNDNVRLKQLHQVYQIPIFLLYESRSFEYDQRQEYEKSVCELILANKLEAAHKLLLEHVAPESIINNKKANIEKLKVLVKEFETLSEYKIGAGVYEEYIAFVHLSDRLDFEAVDYEDKLSYLKNLFDSLINGVSSLEECNTTVKIAKTLMQKQLIKLMFKYNLQIEPNLLLRLKLPESEKNYLEAKIIRNSNDNMITN